MPSVKALIEDVFGKPPSTTLNQDECVARGAAIMGAMLSPNFKVRAPSTEFYWALPSFTGFPRVSLGFT